MHTNINSGPAPRTFLFAGHFILTALISLNSFTKKAGKTDELHDTLNYQLVYNVVKKEMKTASKLIEHIGQRILDSVFHEFPQIQELEVKLSKLNPPLGGKVERVSIELNKKR